jgi:5-phospho-D-xylono-1,4-lactonase
MEGLVRTVVGDVAPEELGPTYGHEHLLTRPAGEQVRGELDLVLDDEQRAAAELQTFVRAGGRALVEASTVELGRNPAGLRRLARRRGPECTWWLRPGTSASSTGGAAWS